MRKTYCLVILRKIQHNMKYICLVTILIFNFIFAAITFIDLEKGNQITSPLQIAGYCNHPDIVQYLIESGSDVNAKGNETALHQASEMGNLEVVKILLKNGADPDIKSVDGKTPKDVAMENNHDDVVQILNKQ